MTVWEGLGSATISDTRIGVTVYINSRIIQVITQHKFALSQTFYFYRMEHVFQYLRVLQHSDLAISDEQFSELEQKLMESFDTTKALETRDDIRQTNAHDSRITLIDSVFEWLYKEGQEHGRI